jgi:hypothetical protein
MNAAFLADTITRNVAGAIRFAAGASAEAILFNRAPWAIASEFCDARDSQIRDAAAITIGGEHLLLHHDRRGIVNWTGLRISMSRLLQEALPLTDRDRDEVYDHLSEHYRQLGVLPPEPGGMHEDRAYELALEGRLALLDDEGNAWMFAESVEDEGRTVPRFMDVGESGRTMLCMPLNYGPMADHRWWGIPRMVESTSERCARLMMPTEPEPLRFATQPWLA